MSAGQYTAVARVVYSRRGAGATGASKQLAPHLITLSQRLKATSEEPAIEGCCEEMGVIYDETPHIQIG